MTRSENISEMRINSGSKTSEVNIFTPMAMGNLFYPYVQDAADNTFVSLTIDILNKNEPIEKVYYNEKLVNSDRNRQYFPSAKDKWGFIETSNPKNTNRNIANAFCFCGQKIQFYIGVKDQDVGYFDNQFVYCKTQLVVSVVDLTDGTNTVLKTFEDFESDLDSSNRYFTWEVPSCLTDLFNDYGLFGMYVIRLDIERTFFTSAELTTTVNDLYTYKNQGLLQLLTYSAPKEALNVDSLVSWLNNKSFSSTAAIEEIFDHTLIYDLEDANMPLTDDQKRAIVADQVAFLFIAQHPTITADYYPSCIVGLGVNATIRSETIISKLQTYSRRYPETIDLIKNRLFGILCTYKKYNFISDIESCFSDYTQSLQNIRDPVKTLFIDRSGNLKTEYGSSGILLNPYVINTTESDLPSDVIFQTTEQITFRKCDVDIGNIEITSIDGTPFGLSTRYALLSFDVFSGGKDISRIRYTLWTSNNLNMFEYTDDNGTSRYHVFDCEDFGNILYSATTGEVLFARIDIEDKNEMVRSFYAEQFVYSSGPGFTTIEAFQRQDGSGMIDIYYDYIGTSEINNSKIDVYYSINNGTSWVAITSDKLRGDFGVAVMPGRNHILWEPVKPGETQDFGEYALVKITLYDINKQDNKGRDSNTSVIRFDRPVVAIRKLTDIEEIEMWNSSSSSSTSMSSSSSSSTSLSSSSTSLSTSSSSSIDSSSSSSTSNSSTSSSSSSLYDTWIPRGPSMNHVALAVSNDGTHMTTGGIGTYIYTSEDYGVTWTERPSVGVRDWVSCAISEDGRYQMIGVSDGFLYISNDFGTTWTAKLTDVNRVWTALAMSLDGSYQTAVCTTGYIYTSANYGGTWTSKVFDAARDWFTLAMSADGRIQTAYTSTGGVFLYISEDYGATWVQTTLGFGMEDLDMSADGQYLIAGDEGGGVWISDDYAATWQMTSLPSGVAYDWFVTMSDDGRTQTAVAGDKGIWTSSDYGTTWLYHGYSGITFIYPDMSGDGQTQALAEYNGPNGYVWVYDRHF